MENPLQKMFVEVAFPVPVEYAFSYILPERFRDDIALGVRVLAPFGPRKTTGFVVGIKDESERTDLKEIEEVLDPIPLFTPNVLQLAKWIAEYYLCGWGEVLKAALPSGIHIDSERMVRLTHDKPEELAEFLSPRAPRQAEIILRLASQNSMPLRKLQKLMDDINIYASLKKLRQDGYVRLELALPRPKVGKKFEIVVRLSEDYTLEQIMEMQETIQARAPKQARLLDILLDSPNEEFTRAELLRHASAKPDAIASLVNQGILRLERKEVLRDYYSVQHNEAPIKLVLNPEQKAALQAVNAKLDGGDFSVFLLHGVTGSGKTQVYIEAIYHTLSKGRTAVVLVPEIALTPQMVTRFRSHFGDKVAVFHSRMSPGERYDSWRQTWEGQHKIVIGPRSAIFAPLKNVGLVVVDEEHEPSYKQDDLTPRYHARDVAVMRAQIDRAVVMLGSATPAIESYFNATVGKYELLSLPNRIDAVPMPVIEIVDLRKEPRTIGRRDPIIFTRKLRQKIDEKLSLGEQIILFLNRRGFATLFKCKECGYVAECVNCAISLTYHLRGRLLKCHYCGYTRRAPDTCPQCNGLDVMFRGIGTQRVEEELHTLFPGVAAIRMDMDTTKGRQAHDKILSQFARGDFRILLGTQMVAKGLDFPNVTLVGVISADTELLFPDFRAGERTFQLLTQVAGRAGRKDKQGEVVIQTYSPEHYSLTFAKTHDYLNFFKAELGDRRDLGYPPFSRLINVLFRGPKEDAVEKVATLIAEYVRCDASFRVLGPAPAPLPKLENYYRWQLLFSSSKQADPGGQIMKKAVRSALAKFREEHRARKVTISIDVDPISIL